MPIEKLEKKFYTVYVYMMQLWPGSLTGSRLNQEGEEWM